MKKAIRYAGLVLGGLVALLLVMLAAARFLITSEQVRSAVLPLAEKALDREISLGDIDIRLFSGIVLHDLTIRDQQGDVPFLQAGRAMLRYRFWPLLRFRVVVDEILLEQPSLRVVRFADGRFNFSDLLDRQKSEGDRKQRSNGLSSRP
jgi:AsmA protein